MSWEHYTNSNQKHFEQFLQYNFNKQIHKFKIHNHGRMVN